MHAVSGDIMPGFDLAILLHVNRYDVAIVLCYTVRGFNMSIGMIDEW